jgi:hypothetical protein
MAGFADELLAAPGPGPAPARQPGGFAAELLGDGSSLTAGDPSHPVTAAQGRGPIFPAEDPSRQAGVLTQAAASLPADLGARVRFFAQKRFPGDPRGMERFFVEGDRIGYIGDDGKPYWEEPTASLSPPGMAKWVASGAGPALPVVGAAGGGMIPFLGGVPGAAAGGAGGDLVRQGLAAAVVGDTGFDPAQTATEAAQGALGQVIGRLMVGLGNRRVVRDIERISSTQDQALLENLIHDARAAGIDLTPAEVTNLRSLRAQQRLLQDMPQSADTMGDFFTRRNTEQVPAAVDRTLGRISGEASTEVGARNLQRGAQSAIESRKIARADMAQYGDALESQATVAVEPIIESVRTRMRSAKGEIRSVLDKALGYLFREVEETGADGATKISNLPDTTVAGLHEAKLAIDALIEGRGENAVSGVAKRELVGLQKRIVGALERAEPKYAEALARFREGSPAIDELTEGAVGRVADASEAALPRVPKVLFEAGPDAVRANRIAFERSGALEDWNAGLRSYLQDSFQRAQKEFVSGNANPGARFRAAVYGTPQQRASLRAAMSDEQWLGFNSLMNVLEATGRVPSGGSMTFFNQEAKQEMSRQAGGGIVRRAANIASPQNLGNKVADWWQEIVTGKHAEKLAGIVTSPEGMVKLKELRKLSPTSERARLITGQLMASVGFGEGQDLLQGDTPPGGFAPAAP